MPEGVIFPLMFGPCSQPACLRHPAAAREPSLPRTAAQHHNVQGPLVVGRPLLRQVGPRHLIQELIRDAAFAAVLGPLWRERPASRPTRCCSAPVAPCQPDAAVPHAEAEAEAGAAASKGSGGPLGRGQPRMLCTPCRAPRTSLAPFLANTQSTSGCHWLELMNTLVTLL